MLTTRCPHCSTQFRIRPEQLSVRGGRVRCGHCQQPFSALAHLEELDDENDPAPSAPAGAPASTPPAAPPVVVQPAPVTPAARPVAPAPTATIASPAVAQTAVSRAKPLVPEATRSNSISTPADTAQPRTPSVSVAPSAQVIEPIEAPAVGDDFTMNIQLDGPSPAEVRAEMAGGLDFDIDGLDEADVAAAPPEPVAEARSEPYVSQIAKELGVGRYDASADMVFGQTVMLEEPIDIPGIPDGEPDRGPASLFDERQRQLKTPPAQVEDRRRGQRHWVWAGGLVLLLLLGCLQFAWLFRSELTRWVPDSRPLLEKACALAGCSVPYPQVIKADGDDLIVIESSSFTPDSTQETSFRLNATVLNKAGFNQAWPHLELTITDRFDIAIARRVLAPAEWLPPAYASLPAFESHSEVTANLTLNLGQLPASGYRLYVFYP
ncbi:DUF3426 domain-containing protein [Uliginosibacterium aquaticum]|uniref:Zinc-ribbon domain-containing protein n=1 Tax=Uliginosibacterium aquaticum TaxID=2731212 RepID=A0ABX2IGY7_9RHOO|nr:DUF3426 domain-containing protein [Uliginosibacterium aquaticum]NSL56074.1 zinc-ribbon domain-containing protein [Uliginosibacterium aquaticum]